MLLALSIVAVVNVVLLVVACCMLYLLMKRRIQAVTAATPPCGPGTTDVEKGSNAVTTEAASAPDHKRPSIGLGQSGYSF